MNTSLDQKITLLAGWLHDKKASDIKAKDVRGLSSIADAVIIVSAGSTRHAQSLADTLMEHLKEKGMEYIGMEGYQAGNWILVDCNDILVHIFQGENRSFYNLEGLYSGSRDIEPELDHDA
ncbi:MAG TPA: ribosome silencing factor [Desulfomicrobiaceae bacterium]|nr:ribosome silencing factor [Desulfomicrobiaceae bacterium]